MATFRRNACFQKYEGGAILKVQVFFLYMACMLHLDVACVHWDTGQRRSSCASVVILHRHVYTLQEQNVGLIENYSKFQVRAVVRFWKQECQRKIHHRLMSVSSQIVFSNKGKDGRMALNDDPEKHRGR
jgi:hypothetical protein